MHFNLLSKIKTLCLCATLIALANCGGGGGDSEVPSTNACGTLGLNTRIINGTQCSTSGSPVLAINLVNRNGSGSLCSGTLITPNQILTAAHCFITEPVLSAYTVIGDRRIFGKKVHVHPSARINAQAGVAENDVAILDMEETINRPTVALLTSVQPGSGEIFSIFGYGINSSGEIGDLFSGEMRIQTFDVDHIIADYEGEGSNTCNGDSGGPAIFTLPNGKNGLIGVTSSGTAADCQKGDHSYFANLQVPTIANFVLSVAPNIQKE